MARNLLIFLNIMMICSSICFGQQIYFEEDSDINEAYKKVLNLIEKNKDSVALTTMKKIINDPELKNISIFVDDETFLGVSEAYRQMVLKMSPETQKMIRFEQNVQAKICLENYKNTGKIEFLEKINSDYFLSDHLKSALAHLFANMLEQGKPEKAIPYLVKLKKNFPETDSNGSVSLKILACYYFVGKANLAENIEKQLLSEHGSQKTKYMGKEATISEIVKQIKSHYVSGAYKHFTHRTNLNWYEINTAPYPGKITKLLWRSEKTAPRTGPFRPPTTFDAPHGFISFWKDNVVVNTGYSIRVLNNYTGKMIYPEVKYTPTGYPSNGNKSCLVVGNTLYAGYNAIDLETGKIKWTFPHNKIPNTSRGGFYTNSSVSSAPAFDLGVLFYEVLIPNNVLSEHFIIAIDADSGKLLWSRFICAISAPQPNNRWGRRVVTPPPPYKGSVGLQVSGDKVFFTNEHGVFGALKKQSGKIIWLKKYPKKSAARIQTNEKNNKGNVIYPLKSNIPIIYDNKVIFAPRNSSDIYWLDPDSGTIKSLFKQTINVNQQTIVYVVGIYMGRLIVYGENFLEFDASNGKLLNQWGDFGLANGFPTISGDYVYVPVGNKIIVASIKETKQVHVFEDSTKRQLGNLTIHNNLLYSSSNDNLCVYQLEKSPNQNIADKRQAFKPDPKAKPEINTINQLIYNLGSTVYQTRQQAYNTLIKMGPGIFPQLTNNLKSTKDFQIQNSIQKMLTQMGYANLNYQNNISRYIAASTNSRRSRYYSNRYITTLSGYGISIYPNLKKEFEHKTQKNASNRVIALQVVGKHKELATFAIPDIVNVLKTDPDPSVKKQACATLNEITGQNFQQNQPEKWEAWYKAQE